MSNALTTCPGPNGDILWALPTVRAIADMIGYPVEFACMPQYESLLPLLEAQAYIEKAFVIPNWILAHSNFGNQPWEPPASACESYPRVWHLGYRKYPSGPLIDFVAQQQGIRLKDPLPFLEIGPDETWKRLQPFIAIAFNNQYEIEKGLFRKHLEEKFPGAYHDVTKLPWLEAAAAIKSAQAVVCCRSSNYVLAHGVGQENIFIYEPHIQRNRSLMFCCPYRHEVVAPIGMKPDKAAEMAAAYLRLWTEKAA